MRRTLALRLTLWYAVVFAVCVGVAFLFFYLLVSSAMRRQTDQELVKQTGVFASLLAVEGVGAVKRLAVIEAQAAGEKQIFFRLLTASGGVFSSSNMTYWQDIGVDRTAVRHLTSGARRYLTTVDVAGRRHRVRVLYERIGPGLILQLGYAMENQTRLMEAFRRMFGIILAVLIGLASVLGWFMARRAVFGVKAVTHTAQQIASGRLGERVPSPSGDDEIQELATTFNRMLDRIEALIAEIKAMSEHLAHDLRSPLTRLRGTAEITLIAGGSPEEFNSMAASTVEECDRLLAMIDTMLVISKTEAGVHPLRFETVDMAALVRDACELLRPVAEDGNLTLRCTVPEKAPYAADVRLMQRLVANLLDNAVKYTPSGGMVQVDLQPQPDGGLILVFSDTGIGVAPDHIPHLFKRFYRADPSRSTAGSGLGLSLALTVARAHGGDITVRSRPSKGSVFTVALPPAKPLDAAPSITKR